MKKILVSVYVLKLDNTFDIEIPINLLMSDVLTLIQDAISEMTSGVYQPDLNAKLYEDLTGSILNQNNIVKFSGIKNGEKLMLV